jgi:hypothetical protein
MEQTESMSTEDTRRLRGFRHIILGGAEAILVPLHGKAARSMRARLILDVPVWETLRRAYVNHWTLVREHGWWRVEGHARPAGKPAKEGRNPRVVLKRLIVAALPGQRVLCVNGDPCDLRRSNLKVVRGAGDERLLPALGDAATDAAHSRRNRATARPTCRRMTDVAGALR